MAESNNRQALRELLVKLTDESLSREDEQRLSEILRSDPDARDCYSQYMDVHALLLWRHTTASVPTDLAASDCPSSSDDLAEFDAGVTTAESAGDSPILGYLQSSVAFVSRPLVASALIVTLIAVWFFGGFDGNPPAPVQPRQLVGKLTGWVDCRWANAANAPSRNDELQAGEELELREGIAEITLTSGVKMILEGPVAIRVDSDMAVHLDAGGLTASVPRGAHGFTVNLLGVSVVDLGTEFGVEVDADGGAIVRVFSGAVNILSQENGKKVERRVVADQIAHIISSLERGESHVALSEKASKQINFVRKLPSRRVAVFQDGLHDYQGTKATFIRPSARASNVSVATDQAYDLMTNFGSSRWLFTDECEPLGTVAEYSRVLLEFSEMVGEKDHQIPLGAKVTSAFLQLHVTGETHAASKYPIELFESLVPWEEDTVSWFSYGSGGAPGEQWKASPVTQFTPEAIDTLYQVDVTESVARWVSGEPNYGWILIAGGDDRAHFDSDDVDDVRLRPKLIVNYQLPEGM